MLKRIFKKYFSKKSKNEIENLVLKFPERHRVQGNLFYTLRIPIYVKDVSISNLNKTLKEQKEGKMNLYEGEPYRTFGYCAEWCIAYLTDGPDKESVEFYFADEPKDIVIYMPMGKFMTVYDRKFFTHEVFIWQKHDEDGLLNLHIDRNGDISAIISEKKPLCSFFDYNEHYHISFSMRTGNILKTIDKATGHTVEYDENLEIVKEYFIDNFQTEDFIPATLKKNRRELMKIISTSLLK